jgi:hypothetical protein
VQEQPEQQQIIIRGYASRSTPCLEECSASLRSTRYHCEQRLALSLQLNRRKPSNVEMVSECTHEQTVCANPYTWLKNLTV